MNKKLTRRTDMQIKIVSPFLDNVERALREDAKAKFSPTVSDNLRDFALEIDGIFSSMDNPNDRMKLLNIVKDRISKLQDETSGLSAEQFHAIVEEAVHIIESTSTRSLIEPPKESKAPVEKPSEPKETPEETAAAKLIQKVVRGHLTRSRIALPKELKPFLRDNLEGFSEEEIAGVSQIIGRHSVEMLRDPEKYKGEGVRLSKVEIKYRDGSDVERNLPMTLWLQLSDDGQTVRVQIYEEFLGEGTYKRVKDSETVEIILTHGIHKPKEKKDTVLVRSKDTLSSEDRYFGTSSEIEEWQQETLDQIQSSISTLMALFPAEELQADPKIMIAGIPGVIRTHQGKKRKKLEWEDVRYTGDLKAACKTGQVSKSTKKGSETVPLKMDDILRISESLQYTVEKMHQKGVIHRDIKPANILMRYNPDSEQIEGYVTDFDLLAKVGINDRDTTYVFWDRCAEQGLVLPTCDTYGVAICLGSQLFGEDFYILSDMRNVLNERNTNSMISELNKRMSNYVINKSSTFSQKLRESLHGARITELISEISDIGVREDYDANTITELEKILQRICEESPELAETCHSFLQELKAAEKSKDLIKEIFEADRDLSTYMKSAAATNLRRLLENPDTSNENKLLTMEIIYRRFPVFRDFRERLLQIQEEHAQA